MLGSFNKSINHSGVSSVVGLGIISHLSVFVFKDLLFYNIVIIFMSIMLLGIVLEVIKFWVKCSESSKMCFIFFLINVVIFKLNIEIRLEVISILLFLFGQISKEICVVLSPSLVSLSYHSSFSSFVVCWVS
jgi:hypothetical protein